MVFLQCSKIIMVRIKITQGKKRASGQHAAQGDRGRSQDKTRRGGACACGRAREEGRGRPRNITDRKGQREKGEREMRMAGRCLPLSWNPPVSASSHRPALLHPARPRPRPPIRLARCPRPRPRPSLTSPPSLPHQVAQAQRAALSCPALPGVAQSERDRGKQTEPVR